MLVLCGKSAAGKNYFLRLLTELGMRQVVTYTTRPIREGERDEVDYHFIPDWLFDKLQSDNFFAETTEYQVANGETWKYGSAVSDYLDDSNSVIILNPIGIKELKKKNISMCVFFLNAKENTRMYRLKKRGDDKNEIARRIRADDEDFKDISKYAQYVVITDSGIDAKCLAKEIYELYQTYQKDVQTEESGNV